MEIGNLPPQAIEAEKSVLCAAMLGASGEIVELLNSADFYRQAHVKIFDAISHLESNHVEVDMITVLNRLREVDALADAGGASYLSSLTNSVPSASSIKHYAGIIKDRAQKRKIITACHDTIKSCYEDKTANEILGELDQKTASIETQDNCFCKIGELLQPFIERLEDLKTNPRCSGIQSGLRDLDFKLGGFQPSNLYIIGARPSMGKSALGMRIGRGAAKSGSNVLFVSIEMSRWQLVARETSCQSGVDGERFRTGDLSASQWEKVIDAAETINDLPIWIDDTPKSDIKGLQIKIRSFIKENGRKSLIIVDYLQYIEGIKSERKDIEIGTVTRGLKESAREHGIPIILLAQLNRNLEQRTDKRPEISDLRGSGDIEQDADVIAFLYRDEVYNKDSNNPNKGIAELTVKKFREGKTGPIFLTWIEHRTTFEDLARGDYHG